MTEIGVMSPFSKSQIILWKE